MRIELLDKAKYYGVEDCYVKIHHLDSGKCSGKAHFCLFKEPKATNYALIQLICEGHKSFYRKIDSYPMKTIIRLTKKDIFYLQVSGKL